MSEPDLPHIPQEFSVSPEFRLLAACSWIAPPEREQDQVEQIHSLCRSGFDWNVFSGLVRRHGVSGIVDTMLRRHAADLMPDAVNQAMKAQHIQVSGRALRQTAELVRISRLFAEESVEMIVMKGALLSFQLYGDPALRDSTDIDLLVPLVDFDRADRLIRTAGYRCTSPGSQLTERQKNYHRSTGQNYEYFHDGNGLKLEIHWRSYNWSQEQTGVVWSRRRSISWMGETFTVLDDDTLLLSLCYHGAHHEWFSLKWLSDVARLLSQDRPGGWGTLQALAGQLGLNRVLAQSVLLVHWIYGLALPGELCAVVSAEKASPGLCRTALRALLLRPHELAAAGKRLDSLRHARYLMQLLPNFPYSEMLKCIVIRDTDFKEFPLPNSLFWLYVPLRPVFWFLRNFRGTRE